MSDHIPEEVIIQILYNLPIKSIVRCTCVCKSWLSLIKNSSFIFTHLNRTITSSTKNPLLLFRHCALMYPGKSYVERFYGKRFIEHYCLTFDNEEFKYLKPFRLPLEGLRPCDRVVSSCNGLICISEDLYNESNTILLWNPLINKFLTLPTPIFTFWHHGYFHVSTGFGFDTRSNDYKVVRIIVEEFERPIFAGVEEPVKEPVPEVEIFSLKANSWKKISNIAPKYEMSDRSPHAFVNGVVHWIAFRRMRYINEFRNVVLGFDMADEVFHEIMLPECLVHMPPTDLSVWVYGESTIALSKIEMIDYKPVRHHIWVMKEYGVVGSWTKIMILEERDGILPTPLGFRKNGEVLLEYRGSIASCDPESKHFRVLRNIKIQEEMMSTFVGTYVESLVLFDKENVVTHADIAGDANVMIDASDVSDPSDATELIDNAVGNVNYDEINASYTIDNSSDPLMQLMLEFMDRL